VLAEHPDSVDLPGFKPTFEGHPRQIRLAAQEIARSERPVILAGHGVLIADATEELRELAEKAQIPVAHTLLGVSAMDETNPLSLGFVGMHGWKHVNKTIQSADLLIALGMRFDDRVTGHVPTFAPYARIVHVDIDPAEIGKNVAVEIPIVGDIKRVLVALIPQVEAVAPEARAAYLAEIAAWRAESQKTPWHGSGAWRNGQLSADFVVSRIGDATGHDATIVADVGQNQMWTARYGGFRVRTATSAPAGSDDGLRPAGRNGRRRGTARQGNVVHRRRRRPADDRAGADDPGPGAHPASDRVAQQPQAGHGPAVAGTRLRGQLPFLASARP